jgi:histone H3/H4
VRPSCNTEVRPHQTTANPIIIKLAEETAEETVEEAAEETVEETVEEAAEETVEEAAEETVEEVALLGSFFGSGPR